MLYYGVIIIEENSISLLSLQRPCPAFKYVPAGMGWDGICCGYDVATAHPTKMLVSLYNVTILQSMHCNGTRRCGVINYWFINAGIPGEI